MTYSDDVSSDLQGKSGHLVVCGGGLLQMFSRCSKTDRWDFHKPTVKLDSEPLLMSLQRKHHKDNLSLRLRNGLSGISETTELNIGNLDNVSKRVKVILYDKPFNPYLVIFCSDCKFATPVAYLKLRQYDVTEVDEKKFKLVRRLRAQDSGTMKNLNLVIFQAQSSFARNNWVETLQPLCRKSKDCCISPCRPKKRLNIHGISLPTLWEDEDVDHQAEKRQKNEDFKNRDFSPQLDSKTYDTLISLKS